jgi:prepilin signal peptidase PulO-like enzyme (type II secretory pathway)
VIVFPLVAVGGVMAIIKIATASNLVTALISAAGAVAILSGLYYLLHWISKGQWIGFGDVKLGLALALLLADWQLAFIALFAANLIGCFIVIPAMLLKKLTRTTRVPFGPLLIIGAVIAMLGGVWLQATYIEAMQWLTTLLLG